MKTAWFYVLLSLARQERYGSDIEDDVRRLSEGRVRLWPATLYGSLEELMEKGWIRELASDEAPADANRARWYRIRPEGRAALVEEVERSEALTRLARHRLREEG
jgi:DNA-binding PadR family transcriptional regulator